MLIGTRSYVVSGLAGEAFPLDLMARDEAWPDGDEQADAIAAPPPAGRVSVRLRTRSRTVDRAAWARRVRVTTGLGERAS